jgi:hypothetical protein
MERKENEKKETRERKEKGEGRRWKQKKKATEEKGRKDCIARKSGMKKDCYDVRYINKMKMTYPFILVQLCFFNRSTNTEYMVQLLVTECVYTSL